jgi:hypothetical protein
MSIVLDPRPTHHNMAEPRATRIHLSGLPHLSTELWMGGAHSASGHRLHPEDFAGAWVIDCAGDMPRHYREPAAWWLTCIFQDYEEQPASWQRLATLAQTIGRTVAGELIEHAIEHPAEPPSRIYVFCNQGMNRSGLVMGRILRALGLAGDEAIQAITAHRPGAVNNLTFARLVRED